MRQKYLISQDLKQKTFKIREYAVIEKNLHNTQTSMLRPEDYSFLHEEIYDGPIIESSISAGMRALVAAIRTPSFFPVERSIARIAESVIELLHSRGNRSLEVFIDDLDGKKNKATGESDAILKAPGSQPEVMAA